MTGGNKTNSKSTLALALDYVAKHPGRYLFPLKAGQKGGPCILDNLAQASNDAAQLAKWDAKFQGCMWGLSLKKSGLLAVDIDTGGGKVGLESYKTLKAAGCIFPKTETQRTPSGGYHLIYSGEHKFSVDKIGKHIDTPNYIVIAGCVRYDGKAYTADVAVPVARVPEWITEKIKPRADRPRRDRSEDAVPLDWFKRALKATPYTGGPEGLDDRHGYGGWLNFLMAAHEAAGGDEAEYMQAIIEWSLDDPSQDDWKSPTSYEYVERKWQSFNDDVEVAVTRASWLKVLNAIGKGDLAAELEPSAASDFANDPLDQSEIDALVQLATRKGRVTFDDFLYSLPDKEFIFIPNPNKMWEGSSVNIACRVGPRVRSTILEAAFKSDAGAKAFAAADKGWNEAEAVYQGANPEPVKPSKRKKKRPEPEPKSYWEQRFSGLDIDGVEPPKPEPEPEDEPEAEPEAKPTEPPPKSKEQELIERVAAAYETSPLNLRAWLRSNGISEPDMNWLEPARMSPTAAIVGDEKRRVAEMTWWPGKPPVIYDTLVRDGGRIPILGTNTFNRYRPALLKPGKFPEPKMWLDHLKLIYPQDWEHLLQFFAWRVQRPDVKILHAIVLGGATRIGKDTMVRPLHHAVGPWNFTSTNAQTIMDDPKNNSYLEGVLCLVSEAKDFGEKDRFGFYERMKPWLGGTASETVQVADKYIRVHPVIDVWAAIITTNFKVRGIFLPPDDARHYVAWSNRTWEDWGFKTPEILHEKYFKPLHDWYNNGGNDAVAYYLMNLPLDENFAKSPPPKTEAWHEIVAANMDVAGTKLAEILETLGNPSAVTVSEVRAADKDTALEWADASPRKVAAEFEDVGYVQQRNRLAKDGKWCVGAKRRKVSIYVRKELDAEERAAAADEVFKREQRRERENESGQKPKPTVKPKAAPKAPPPGFDDNDFA
jgi:hypothetical protein